ncbi:MAG: hypothetical protein HYY28_15620 [Betaproteobacteria bacterium]|nr:hypothetical protein [Betaproteobacteria bacterium]MBI2961740.1 hypothetical protein [Betaproteobacteria bacterium]
MVKYGCVGAAALLVAGAAAQAQTGAASTYAALAPILAERCVVCHSGDSPPLGLRLDTFDGIIAGSRKGPVVKSGDASGSELVRRLKGTSAPRMPMTGPPFLADEQIALFERWVSGGLARGDPGAAPAAAKSVPERPAEGEPVTYRHVAPILAARCAKCHADNGLMGAAPEGYRLTSLAATLSSAERARVVPGRPEASELLRRIRGQALPRMPYDGPPYLGRDEIRMIEDWIAQGARDARGKAAALPAGAALRLHGRLAPGWRLDALDLALTAGTRIDKSPRPGDYVEVRGRVDPSGNVWVERLRRR